jgi:hypothetical protein
MSSHADADLVYDDGVDRSTWQARSEDLEPDLRTTPAEALPELARLVREVEEALGVLADSPGALTDEDSAEVLPVADRLDADELVSGEEVVSTVEAGLRLAWYLVQDRRGPYAAIEEET